MRILVNMRTSAERLLVKENSVSRDGCLGASAGGGETHARGR